MRTARTTRPPAVPFPSASRGRRRPSALAAPAGPESAGSLLLRCGPRAVARYVYGPRAPHPHLWQPCLHPVRTLGGAPVTGPAPRPAGRPGSGGPPGPGAALAVRAPGRPRQRHTGWMLRDQDGFVEELDWLAQDGTRLLTERRTVAVQRIAGDRWALDFTTALTAAGRGGLVLHTPVSPDAPVPAGGGPLGGGFFWHLPVRPDGYGVLTPHGDDPARAHGRRCDWLALRAPDWTLVLTGATAETRAEPWTLGGAGRPGAGSALAGGAPLVLEAGETVTRRVVTAVADGRLTARAAARLAGEGAAG